MDYKKCPQCGVVLDFENGSEAAQAHIKAHIDEQLELHPEVPDLGEGGESAEELDSREVEGW